MTEDTFYPQRFSDDEYENLRIENEILQMKLQAQFGGISNIGSDLSVQEENRFLKQVLALEEQYGHATLKKVYEVIGSPAFIKSDALDEVMVSRELKRIEQLMKQHRIELGFLAPRNDRFKYRFITEELFEYEMEDIKVPGMINCFTYEAFHPDDQGAKSGCVTVFYKLQHYNYIDQDKTGNRRAVKRIQDHIPK